MDKVENVAHSILVAEDEEHIAKLISFKLSKEGFSVTLAKNGKEAIDLFPAKSWSAVVVDIMMPLVDGWQVLKAIRSSTHLVSVPVLMLTAKSFQRDISNAAELGATRFLKKPFDPDELVEVLRQMTGEPLGK